MSFVANASTKSTSDSGSFDRHRADKRAYIQAVARSREYVRGAEITEPALAFREASLHEAKTLRQVATWIHSMKLLF